MAVSIEDILLARSVQDQQAGPDMGTSALIRSAGLGGTAGIALGDLAERLRPMTQQRAMPSGVMSRLKPGHRMAGGLVGAILGGALGAGTKADDAAEFTCCKYSCKTASSRRTKC